MNTIFDTTRSDVNSPKIIRHSHRTLSISMIDAGYSRVRMALSEGIVRLTLTFLFTFLFAFSGGHASAQIATADVSGSIHDSSAALIPGATVTATQVSTGVVTTTTANSAGIFVFSTLPVGTYVLRVTAPGFAAYEQTNLSLAVGEHLTVDASLKVGTSSETITVASTAVALDSTSPTIQSVIEEKIVQNLPLNGRNPATLAYTVAGVVDSAANPINRATNSSFAPNDAVSAQESAPSVHGSRPGGTYFSLDAANNTDPYTVVGGPFPNPDATGEFSVVTGTYGAQYVSAPGGAINIVSRSGGNQIHGTLFEFIRNGYFNAQNRFITPPAKDNLKRNQFGGAIGAPLQHDRLFVFGSYQATPVRDSTTTGGTFPTAAERTGDFGSFQIPSYFLSPATQNMLNYLPVGPTATGGFLTFQVPNNSVDQQGIAKVDLDVAKHRVFARVFYDRYNRQAAGPTAPAFEAATQTGLIQTFGSAAIGDTWTAGKFTLQTSASFLRVLSSTTAAPNDDFSLAKLGLSNLSGTASDPAIGLTYVLGRFSAGGGAPEQYPRSELEVSQNVYATIGRHQISFGGNYRHINDDESNYSGQNIEAVYVGLNSYLYGAYGIIPGATFNATADFLLGAPFEFLQQDGYFAGVTGNLIGFFGEDNFRVTKKLTATMGLRWDPYLAYTPKQGRINCFAPGSQSNVFTNALPGLLYPGDSGCAKNGVPSDYLQVQPRVGLAYAATPNIVVRAGFGLYTLQLPESVYSGFSAQPFTRNYLIEQPFLSIDNLWGSAMLTNPFAAGFQGKNYQPAKNIAFQPGLGASAFSQNFKPGYVQQWSLSVQQTLSQTDSVEMAYVGTEGVHLTHGVSENTPVYSATASASNEQARRPYQDFTNIGEIASSGTSSYNGVDVSYRHRSKLFTVSSAFSWSKALDDGSSSVNAGTINLPNSNHNFRRGRSDFDQNFVFRNTFTTTSPKLQDLNFATRSVLGSWTLSGLVALDAGQPFSVTDGGDFSYTGLNIDYADRVPGQPLYVNGMLNFKAFKDNAPGTFGDSGRNAYRSPSYKEVDLAAEKAFPIRKEFQLLFRAEAFNIANHPNLLANQAATSYSTTAQQTFGVYGLARDPRILQFSLKASF
jgi:hypothetical protein